MGRPAKGIDDLRICNCARCRRELVGESNNPGDFSAGLLADYGRVALWLQSLDHVRPICERCVAKYSREQL